MLTELPLVIDSHVHFRTPGKEYKENWLSGSQAARHGGVGLVFDMPNNAPSIDSLSRLKAKRTLIEKQLAKSEFPLKYRLYFGAADDNSAAVRRLKGNPWVCGVKVYMGATTGDLLVPDDDAIKRIFEAAQQAGKIVALHAEDNYLIDQRTKIFRGQRGGYIHSLVRSAPVALSAVQRVIKLMREAGNAAYICHVSTKEELDAIRDAKQEGLPIYAEVCPHHLFFSMDDYAQLGCRIKMSPPVRTPEDHTALWQALNDGTVDVLATDHAPHLLEEKLQSVWRSASGVPGIETLLPLMLDSVNHGRLSLERLAELTHRNIVRIFELGEIEGKTIVDMDVVKEVQEDRLATRCGWSPFAGQRLRGWPVKVISGGREYACYENGC